MTLGFIGLGRMGGGMSRRLLAAGHTVVVYDPDQARVDELVALGAKGAPNMGMMISSLPDTTPKIVWMMVPQKAVEEVLGIVTPLLSKGSILIDGGNSNFNLSKSRGESLSEKGIRFLDVGTSGGLGGEKIGYSMMVGGDAAAYEEVRPIFEALAIPEGLGYFGSYGAGHFVKMTHNAIEYGMMQAMGEGFDLLKNGPYSDMDLLAVTKVWNHGSIVRSYLMEMAEQAFREDPKLDSFDGVVGDSGEGKWSVETALQYNIPFTVNSFALFYRYITRQDPGFGAKVIGALRKQFGGHTNKERA
jgi:6-phosphogluconate dehydrogenase